MPVACYESITFQSAIGWISVLARRQKVVHLTFRNSNESASKSALASRIKELDADCAMGAPSRWLERLATRIINYTEGEPDPLQDIEVDLSGLADFQSKVVRQCRKIPYGSTVSYAELASRAGSPSAARAVGNVMAQNKVPLIIPCHRVICSTGKLGGFSAPGGIKIKSQLLDLESSLLAHI